MAKLYFFTVVIYFLFRIIVSPPPMKTFEVLKACAYVVGVEVLFRMTDGGVFYEASKYLVILFILFGMFYKGISGKGYPYFIYLILLVPGVIVASNSIGLDANFRTNVAFVLSGPVCLGVSALYCFDKKISKKQILDIIKVFSFPIIAMTVYVYLYTPKLEDVLRGTESNYATSGGFGPNQTSTILGLGMFCLVVRFFLKSPTMLLKIVNASIFMFMSYRAIITFSRGGVFAAIIIIALFLFTLYKKSSLNQKNQIITTAILLGFIAIGTWLYSAQQTDGLIENRYTNKDALGREKEDVSTGRVDLFVSELDGFINHPFLGVGASGMKEFRIETSGKGVVSHNEISRVLSEHGLFGVVIILILVIKPLGFRSRNKRNIFFYAFLGFWFATINHSAMRIAAPSFIYALALLNIRYEKRPIHRKRVIEQR
ncbi:O-antigen ligase family protein [Winogradskyella ouciana]|uniref:O-antigen ligase family protein n=1 Tax=Winogradskyella ouciana TaxID=2608631 RepID=UPI001F41E62E|nr:O-antigen ligase family protein [Winogradskyella ouciana]